MDNAAQRNRLQAVALIVLALLITIIFYRMVASFVETVFLAAVFAGMMYGVYRRLVAGLRGRRGTASALTVAFFVLVLIVPLSVFLGVVVSQAVQVTSSVGPWVQREISTPDRLTAFLQRLPFWESIQPYQGVITSKLAEMAGRVGSFVVGSVAAASRGTAVFFFHLFILLYAMFFFLLRGKEYLARLLYCIPLAPEAENRLVAKFTSVARATIKGTLVIGVVQGGLAGLAFLVVGIDAWAFWSVVMMVLSIIPGIGTALVWVPAVIYLFAVGSTGPAIGLAIWCVLVVGMVDNVLRPRLVGRDTQMSDLLVMISTLGGIVAFGASGFIIGPIVAALWVTVWEIYGDVFSAYLPRVEMAVTDTVADLSVVVPPGADASPVRKEREPAPAPFEEDGGDAGSSQPEAEEPDAQRPDAPTSGTDGR